MRYNVFGITFEISYYFLCAVCLSLAFDKSRLLAVTLLAAALHEAGHLLFMLIFKGHIHSVKLTLGCLGIEYRDNFTKGEEIICLLAGSFSNLVFGLVGRLFGFNTFFIVNLVLGIYNLLPVHGLDGGMVLAKALESRVEQHKISVIIDILTLFVALLFLLLFFIGTRLSSVNISLILLALYLLIPVFSKKLVER